MPSYPSGPPRPALSRRAHGFIVVAFALSATHCKNGPSGEAPAASAAPAVSYGAPLTLASPRAKLSTLLERPSEFAGKTITVQGKVRRACSRKGCWMELAETLTSQSPGCRVTFKDYGFFVPTDSEGARATVEGEVILKQVPRSRVAHLEAEGATFEHKNPDGSASEVQLVATGVELIR
jgi:hypothetical protein